MTHSPQFRPFSSFCPDSESFEPLRWVHQVQQLGASVSNSGELEEQLRLFRRIDFSKAVGNGEQVGRLCPFLDVLQLKCLVGVDGPRG